MRRPLRHPGTFSLRDRTLLSDPFIAFYSIVKDPLYSIKPFEHFIRLVAFLVFAVAQMRFVQEFRSVIFACHCLPCIASVALFNPRPIVQQAICPKEKGPSSVPQPPWLCGKEAKGRISYRYRSVRMQRPAYRSGDTRIVLKRKLFRKASTSLHPFNCHTACRTVVCTSTVTLHHNTGKSS